MPKKPATAREYFKFDLSTWLFEYSFHVNADVRKRDPLGACWESHSVVLEGSLCSKTKRKNCQRVRLRLVSSDVTVATWDPKRKGFGSVDGVQQGTLKAMAFLPSASFGSFVTALGAGKVQRCYLGVRDVVRGAGAIEIFFTIDPATDDE
jgi:hypothetical protein